MATDPTFRMPILDTFTITGLGTVVSGQIEAGTINVYDTVFLQRPADSPDGTKKTASSIKTGVVALQGVGKAVKQAHAGDNVGVVLRGVKQESVQIGDVLSGVQ